MSQSGTISLIGCVRHRKKSIGRRVDFAYFCLLGSCFSLLINISYFLHFCLLPSLFLYNFGLVSENFASPHSAVPATLICQSLDRQSICDSIELKWTVSNLISKSKSRFDERQAGRRARAGRAPGRQREDGNKSQKAVASGNSHSKLFVRCLVVSLFVFLT